MVGPATAAGVLAVSAVLIALAAAPVAIPWRVRAVLIAAVAVGLALLRPTAGYGADASSAGIIPIIATMFMFRMVIYLYELKHARAPEPLVDTLAYFFLLPNYCFLHFPVVDYRTLQRGYFAAGRPRDPAGGAGDDVRGGRCTCWSIAWSITSC